MAENQYLAPAEIATVALRTAETKAAAGAGQLLALGLIAGVFIGLAAQGSNMAAYNLLANPATYGLGRSLVGVTFGTGLMLILVAGGELFTGNCLMILGPLEKRFAWPAMLRNWALVYLGNFIGSQLIVWLIYASGLLNSSAGLLGGMTAKIAASKVSLSFGQALASGILCNLPVCGAVWMSYGAKDIISKLGVCFFPVWLFATSGFEHSVANMYFIPAGILAAANPTWTAAAGLDAAADLAGLTWGNFFTKNLFPVTIGNILGGACLVGGVYWFCYLRGKNKTQAS
ncbi:MAG: formate/nitrite transporter family protein [Peptococcaceae bacterium]|jgi:formate/nitrite transporter|nr:formate/nitrite transporter family protein [Peptococcaceae bacterium]